MRELIRQGLRNADLVVTLVISAVVLTLNIIGLAQQQLVLQAVLAVAAILSFALLRIRLANDSLQAATERVGRQIADANFHLQAANARLVRREYPDFSGIFANSETVHLIGESLYSTIHRYSSELQEAFRKGTSVKVVVPNTSPDVLKQLLVKSFLFSDSEKLKLAIDGNVDMLFHLNKSWALEEGFSVRRYPAQVPFGLVISQQRDGQILIWVKLLSFKTAPGNFLVIALNSKENEAWVKFFEDQFNRIWEISEE